MHMLPITIYDSLTIEQPWAVHITCLPKWASAFIHEMVPKQFIGSMSML